MWTVCGKMWVGWSLEAGNCRDALAKVNTAKYGHLKVRLPQVGCDLFLRSELCPKAKVSLK